MTSSAPIKLLSNIEAANMLGLKPTTLEIWRTRGKGPKFVKLGISKQAPIRYEIGEILSWLEAQCFNSTSAYPTPVTKQESPREQGANHE